MAEQKKMESGDKKIDEKNFTIIDGTELVLGRMGSKIAKRLLLGESISIVNCKDVIILGRKNFLVQRYKNKLSNKVTKKGPYYSRSPANIVKRALRNMVPYRNSRGKEALDRLKCFNSVPSILLNSPKSSVEEAKVLDEDIFYYTRVEDICKILGYDKRR